MANAIQVGTEVAPGFKVVGVRNRSVASSMDNPIIDFVEVQLDCMYENAAFLHLATFLKSPPAQNEWVKVALTGGERICGEWSANGVKGKHIAIAYRRQEQGRLMAVTNIITTKGNTLVSAQLLWFGFPLINSFYVGFKPGMRDRTEELLLASLPLV